MIGSVPLVASVLILFGFMGFAGIALDAATALLSSIMIGVGVDFTIQYIWCFNLQIKSGLSYPEATSYSFEDHWQKHNNQCIKCYGRIFGADLFRIYVNQVLRLPGNCFDRIVSDWRNCNNTCHFMKFRPAFYWI